ncbi:MAG: hypothetical protein H6701_08145 [Myxococcales bacterium]|nr:hypothetical protein [Myxococcales bacterium]
MNPKHTLPLIALLAGCGDADEKIAQQRAPLTAVCVDEASPPPADGWRCDERRVVECDHPDGAQVDYLYVERDGLTCDEAALTVSDAGPYLPGEHVIAVTRTENNETFELCTATLAVVDTTPPVVEPRTVELWPPNHRLHAIHPLDCVDVYDACDEDIDVRFTFASSDEPANDRGDGNTEPDIVDFGCDGVSLRAERQGGGDGRVYTLGWQATDDSGNVAAGTCQVVVPHDRSGRAAVDSGEDHRVDGGGTCGDAGDGDDNCDGECPDDGEKPESPPAPVP